MCKKNNLKITVRYFSLTERTKPSHIWLANNLKIYKQLQKWIAVALHYCSDCVILFLVLEMW